MGMVRGGARHGQPSLPHPGNTDGAAKYVHVGPGCARPSGSRPNTRIDQKRTPATAAATSSCTRRKHGPVARAAMQRAYKRKPRCSWRVAGRCAGYPRPPATLSSSHAATPPPTLTPVKGSPLLFTNREELSGVAGAAAPVARGHPWCMGRCGGRAGRAFGAARSGSSAVSFLLLSFGSTRALLRLTPPRGLGASSGVAFCLPPWPRVRLRRFSLPSAASKHAQALFPYSPSASAMNASTCPT
jgi:hypothetical protein